MSQSLRCCGHCGRSDVGSFFGGYSFADGHYLCHPNVAGRPDCYRLVTLYGHPPGHEGCDGELKTWEQERDEDGTRSLHLPEKVRTWATLLGWPRDVPW